MWAYCVVIIDWAMTLLAFVITQKLVNNGGANRNNRKIIAQVRKENISALLFFAKIVTRG
jgi:hypothetical protein